MSEVNWRRAIAVSSLIMAFLLICGSIYLHIRQKHHLGRLRHQHIDHRDGGDDIKNQQEPEILMVGGVETSPTSIMPASAAFISDMKLPPDDDAEEADQIDSNASPSSEEIKEIKVKRHHPITEACLQCLCSVVGECRQLKCGAKAEDCGVFRISYAYWSDANKPRLEGDNSLQVGAEDDDKHYSHCVNNFYCAARTVAAYMHRYARDCNGDRLINCRDFIAIHLNGPSGCVQQLNALFELRMESCLARYEII